MYIVWHDCDLAWALFFAIALCDFAAVAITTAGTSFSWGRNDFGHMGIGNTTNYSSPKQIGALTDWSIVSASDANFVAIKTSGTLWSWGKNNYGQLGLGDTTNISSPNQIGSVTTWNNVGNSAESSFALG